MSFQMAVSLYLLACLACVAWLAMKYVVSFGTNAIWQVCFIVTTLPILPLLIAAAAANDPDARDSLPALAGYIVIFGYSAFVWTAIFFIA